MATAMVVPVNEGSGSHWPANAVKSASSDKTEALFSTNDWCEIKVAERQARSHGSSSDKYNV